MFTSFEETGESVVCPLLWQVVAVVINASCWAESLSGYYPCLTAEDKGESLADWNSFVQRLRHAFIGKAPETNAFFVDEGA